MKNIWLAVIILIVGCQSSAESSFNSLSQAFISWYYKFHPVEATRFGIGKHHNSFRLIGISDNEEYIADISRFIIELSQIDATKLSPEIRVDHQILYSHLEKIQYVMNDIRPWEWNPLWVLDEIYDGLFLLSERREINMDDRVTGVQGRLKLIPEILSLSKEMIISHSSIHIEHGKRRIDRIIHLINQLPIKLNSDNLTLDEIDRSIIACKESLLNYLKWLNQTVVHKPNAQFPLNMKLSDQAFSYYIGKKYLPHSVYKLVDKKRISIQNNIFNLSLPIYLTDNDEPIWLDRDDTLEVIHWTIDHIRNKPENQVLISSILSNFYESISHLQKLTNSKGLIPKNINKRTKLSFSPEYIKSGSHVQLFDHHPKELNSEILYYIRGNGDSEGLFPLISYEIDLMNARYIIPGRSVQIAHAQNYPSHIRYLFPDPLNIAGWQIYAVQMILNEELKDWDNEYHILRLKEEVMVISQAFIEGEYYSGKMNRKNALSYIKKQAFLNDSEAEALMVQSDLHYFTGIQAFIGMMEINSILTEYKKNKGEKFQINQFNKAILEKGIIPFNQLKKQVLSM